LRRYLKHAYFDKENDSLFGTIRISIGYSERNHQLLRKSKMSPREYLNLKKLRLTPHKFKVINTVCVKDFSVKIKRLQIKFFASIRKIHCKCVFR